MSYTNKKSEAVPARMERVARAYGSNLERSIVTSGVILLIVLLLVALRIPSATGLLAGLAWMTIIGVAVTHRLALERFRLRLARVGQAQGLSEAASRKKVAEFEEALLASRRGKLGAAMADQDLA